MITTSVLFVKIGSMVILRESTTADDFEKGVVAILRNKWKKSYDRKESLLKPKML